MQSAVKLFHIIFISQITFSACWFTSMTQLAKEVVERMYENLKHCAFCEIFQQLNNSTYHNYKLCIIFILKKLKKKNLIQLFCIFIFDEIRWKSFLFLSLVAISIYKYNLSIYYVWQCLTLRISRKSCCCSEIKQLNCVNVQNSGEEKNREEAQLKWWFRRRICVYKSWQCGTGNHNSSHSTCLPFV